MMVLEYVVGGVAIITVVLGTVGAGLALLLTPPGLMAAFVAVWTLVAAVGSGTTLLAVDFLFPAAVDIPGLAGLLWLVVPASLASATLFDLVLEGGVLALLKRTGLDLACIHQIEALLGGVFLGLALVVTASLLSGVGVSPVAALAAGLISAFTRYYLGMWLDGALGAGDGAESFDGETD